MFSETHVHVTKPPTCIFLGVDRSGVQSGGRFSLIEAVMSPGGDGGLHARRLLGLTGESGISILPLPSWTSAIRQRIQQ